MASEHALAFIAEHGGKLYVWTDEHDFGHAKSAPPKQPVELGRVRGGRVHALPGRVDSASPTGGGSSSTTYLCLT